MLENERLLEENRLKRTLEEIDRQLQEKYLEEQTYVKNMRSTFKNMWEEVEGAPNNKWELDQLMQAKAYLDEMRNMQIVYQSSAGKLARLKKMTGSPYFARIDFVEKGESTAEEIYIGLTMVQNEDSLEILVYDWRAPVAGMFYDFDTGPASYVSPSGIIEGKLTLKRQFRIKNGRMEMMFDSDVKIDDDILQELLGQSKDEKMKNIVTSIQREQNTAIRDEGHKLLIVEGPAGSGKTSIALHRVAYLLYRYRQSITNANVVILSPNEMFNDYISEVLPELGEENVRQTTFMEYAKSFLKDRLKITDLNEQMEFILSRRETAEYAIRSKAIQYKSSIRFLSLLKEYIEWLYQNPWEFEDIIFDKKSIISREEQIQLFYTEYSYLPLMARLKKIKNRSLFLIKQQELASINELLEQMNQDIRWNDVKPQERKRRAVRMVLKHFQPVRKKVREIGRFSILDLYQGMYRSFATEELSEMLEYTLKHLHQGIVLYEDLPPMLYLKGKMYGIPRKESIRQVIIDEVQDYTPLMMEMVRELFPSSSFTVVGDLNQSLNPFSNIGNIEALKDIFQTKELAHVRLGKSYRSTREITAFCNAILGVENNIAFINREGQLPKVHKVSGYGECIGKLQQDIHEVLSAGYKSVAVIGRTRDETKEIYESLKKTVPAKLVVQAESEFPKGIAVIPSYLSKGLEFDAVFVLNLDKPYCDILDQKLFYTVCTRALHRLTIYSVTRLPEYLDNVPENLYELVE